MLPVCLTRKHRASHSMFTGARRELVAARLGLSATLFVGLSLAVSAAAPDVRSLMPAGGQRGATVEVAASGNFPKWPVRAWVDRPGVAVVAGSETGKLSATIAADAPPGLYWLRLYDAYGAAAPQPFIVGTLDEVVEHEPNDSPQKAQALDSTSVVVNGRLGANRDVDVFARSLAKGQTLVASLEAHEKLGSPVDAALQVLSPRGGVLAFNHDEQGLDPQIVFDAPADGIYFVRLFGFPATPNTAIALAGGDQYVYRLTLTTGPFADYAWPLAVTRGRETRVELAGWNIPDALRSLSVKADDQRSDIFDPRLANVVALSVEPHNTIVETEPNGPAAPQSIELPVTVTGRIEGPNDVDVFAFNARGGESLTFELESRGLGFPLDGVLEISDMAGKSLARVDDANSSRDPLAAFSAPADGQYRITVSDLTRQGSSRHVYRLRATRTQADFELTVDAHAYALAAGKPTEIAVSIERRNGFAEEIDLNATGLPGFVTVNPARSAGQGETAKTVKLALSAKEGAFSGPIRIAGQATGASHLARAASAAIPGRAARTTDLWLTVVPAQ
jgi:hypothetical protein